MRYGPDRVLCTNEFASALNLENNEMQDPNEVSLMDAYVYPTPRKLCIIRILTFVCQP